MEQFPAAKETQPHGPADLTDQSTVFLMLEELGIASMQRDWLEANAPESDDCKDAAEQAEEFSTTSRTSSSDTGAMIVLRRTAGPGAH